EVQSRRTARYLPVTVRWCAGSGLVFGTKASYMPAGRLLQAGFTRLGPPTRTRSESLTLTKLLLQ
ncbi:DNA topoisomerase 1, partial [Dissostichus eleginoides]